VSNDEDDDEPVTDINVEIDASALVAGVSFASRENVVTIPAPPLPADGEANTVRPLLVRRLGTHRALPAEYDEAHTGEHLIAPGGLAEEEDSTALNLESRIRKALAPLDSEPPLEETKQRPASSSVLRAVPEVASGESLDLPKSSRGFSMDLPQTVPMPFAPSAHVPVEPDSVAPRGPKGTVKLISTAEGVVVADAVPRPASPRPHRSPPPTVVVKREPRRRRGRWLFVLALLALVAALAYVKRSAVTAFVLKTTASIRASR
jgi:hypothetical protein